MGEKRRTVMDVADVLQGFQSALATLKNKKPAREMSMGTHELLKQLDDAFKLCDQRTKDLELAAQIGQQLLQTNMQLTAEIEGLMLKQDALEEQGAYEETDE